jgi:hypothetical protein
MRNIATLISAFVALELEDSPKIILTKQTKTISPASRGGPYCCETTKFPHFLENRFKDGSGLVSFMGLGSA